MRYFNLMKTLANWWLYLAVKFSVTKQDPLLFRTRRGIRVEVPRRLLHTFKEIFMDECYMKGLEKPVPERPTILDIGANAGYFSLFAANRFPGARILAVEPLPVNFRQLERNVGLNPGTGIICLQKAVAGRSGSLTMAYDARDRFSTGATVLKQSSGQTDIVEVSAVTLPELFDLQGLEHCELVKMDCEGAEYEILYRCPSDFLSRISQMALEVHKGPEPGQDIGSLETYLLEQGFLTRQQPVGMLWAWRS